MEDEALGMKGGALGMDAPHAVPDDMVLLVARCF